MKHFLLQACKKSLFMLAGGVFTLSVAFAADLPPAEGLQLWLRADAGVSVTNGGYVTEWLDQSGQGRDFSWINEGATNAPLLGDTAPGKNPSLSFENNVQLFRNSPDVNLFASDQVDVFVVTKPNDPEAFTMIQLQMPDEASARASIQLYNSGKWYFDYGNTNAIGGRLSGEAPEGWLDHWHIVELCRTPQGEGSMLMDSVNVASGAFSDNLAETKAGRLAIMGGGEIAEILIYNRSLSEKERDLVNRYLRTKYHLN